MAMQQFVHLTNRFYQLSGAKHPLVGLIRSWSCFWKRKVDVWTSMKMRVLPDGKKVSTMWQCGLGGFGFIFLFHVHPWKKWLDLTKIIFWIWTFQSPTSELLTVCSLHYWVVDLPTRHEKSFNWLVVLSQCVGCFQSHQNPQLYLGHPSTWLSMLE